MDDETPGLMIDSPLDFLPDLSGLGIEEVDKGVCLDTPENRQTLRLHKYTWRPILSTEGEFTQLLQVISPELQQAISSMALDTKLSILEDPSRKNSDYLTGAALLMERDSDKLVPAWVLAATREWNKVEERRENGEPRARPALAGPPGRCRAVLSTGTRCQYWHGGRVGEDGLCRTHLVSRKGDTEVHYTEKARNRLKSTTLAAAERLEELMYAASEPVALKAVTEVLDRNGIRGGIEVDQTVKHEIVDAGNLLAERLKKLNAIEAPAKSNDDIMDAEVVDDERP